ncbi:hypothetical protein [Xanthomonas hortorum]|uniref:Integrase catalytic domain-containing protein n=1 Tax=Xanthomonas hortorum pv. hederae TaxID=453603 RepID=A0A9X4BVM3_9XANT|nr:hypothetical protein [Xanthomonas hortorum]MDC8640412.1 hypothetical protein [Xanthomonas hortorum pv. hederae]
MFGFYALIPRMTVASYRRRASFNSESSIGRRGHAGLFVQLMSEHPDLYNYVKKQSLARPKESASSVAKAIHQNFLKSCAKVRGPHEYPFAVNSQGRPALANTIRRIRQLHRVAPAAQEAADAADNYGFPLIAQPSSSGRLRPYEEVEQDGHNGDFYFVVKMPGSQGDWIYTTPMRLWLLLIIDRASRAIIGYAYRLGSTNYPAVSVMRSFVHMLTPWQPMTLTLPGLAYKTGAGFPSGVVPGLAGLLPDLVCFDNAKANIARLTVLGLCDSLGVTLNFGRAGSATARSFVERLNLTLETHGFRRLPGGFNPKGPKEERERALKAAEAHPLELHQLEQVIDVLLANYNADPHESLMGRSPNEYLQLWARTSTSPRRQSADSQLLARSLTRVEYVKRLRGGPSTGRSPYVELMDARYSNDVVRRMVDSVGKPIRLIADIDGDFRLLRGYLLEGNQRIDLGVLKAAPPWHLTPHTLEQRKMILTAKRAGKIVPRPGEDMAQAFRDLKTREARERKSAANVLARAGTLRSESMPVEAHASDKRLSRRPWIKIK